MSPIILLIGGVFVLFLLIIGAIVAITSERSLVEERLGRFLEDDRPQPEQEAGGSIITEWLNRRVAKSSMGDRVARELARADLKFKVAEYYALVFMSTAVTALLAYIIQPIYISAPANDLARICFEDKSVQKVILRVEKPGAVRFAKSVGVEIERNRNA